MAANILTLPNAFSGARILAGPICIYLLMSQFPGALWVCLCVMLFSELSDFLDGFIARTLGQVSSLGKILDPMSDSLYRISIFVAFVAKGWMPAWMFLIILSRDIIVSYLRIMAEQQIGTLSARSSGKWKALVQSVAQILVVGLYALYGGSLGFSAEQIAYFALLAATLVTAYSLLDYGQSVFARLP